MRGIKNVVTALVIFLLVVILGVLLYVYVGAYDVAASEPHSDAVSWFLSTAKVQSIRAHADPLDEPLPTDSAAIWTGFEHYDAMCTTCHGGPGVSPSEIGEGINPPAPELDEDVMETFSDAQLVWILTNGIKMTGMPAYGETHSREELRAITAFVKQLPDMSMREYRSMRDALASSGADSTGAPGGHTHSAGDSQSHEH